MIVLNSQELADIWGVCLSTVHNWVKRKKIPHHKTLGGQLRFDPKELRAFFEAQQMQVPKKLVEMTENPWRSSK